MKLDYSKFLKKNKCKIFLFHGVRSKEKFEISITRINISPKDFKLIYKNCRLRENAYLLMSLYLLKENRF